MKVAFGALFFIIAPFSMGTKKSLSHSRGNNDGNADIGGETAKIFRGMKIQFHGITMLNARQKKKNEKKKHSLDEPSGLINFRRFFSRLWRFFSFSLIFMRKKSEKLFSREFIIHVAVSRVSRKKGISSRTFCCRSFNRVKEDFKINNARNFVKFW
jgi:hypothetical protein